MFVMPENKWARLLAYVAGLHNQKLLLQNEYLAAENPSSALTFPRVCAFRIPSDRPSLKSASGSAGLRFSRSLVSPNPTLSSPGTGGSLPANLTAPITDFARPAPHRARTGSAHCALRQRELRLGIRPHRRSPGQSRPRRFQTVGNILRRYEIQPAPMRSPNTTWK